MKNNFSCRLTVTLLAIAAVFSMVSCSQELIPDPTMEKITSGSTTSSTLYAPASVTATHGGYKSVTLEWKATSNASQYKIYAAETPYDSFIQVAETKDDSTTITVSEEAGVKKYYRVSTVDYNKNESPLSNFVYGSTLAAPVITGIESSEDGTQTTISWWMENCDNSTYLKSVKYEISVYDENKVQVGDAHAVDGSVAVTGSDDQYTAVTSYTIKDLSPKTTYYYKVEAFVLQHTDKKEASDMLDAETARRLTPKAPENLTVTQGTNDSTVSVKWTLPEFTDVAGSSGVYERHPLYFTVERKVKDAEDKTYVKLAEKVSSVTAADAAKKIYRFYCTTTSSNVSPVSVEPSSDSSMESSTTYTEYIQGSVVCFEDKTAVQGTQYTYRVQSYVDDTKKTISSDECKVQSDGWLIPVAKFSTSAVYTKSEDETKILGIKINYSTDFNDFNAENVYSYSIQADYSSFDNDPVTGLPVTTNTSDIYTTQSLENLKQYSYEFAELNSSTEGYYKYTLLIRSIDGAAVYQSVPAGERYTVTSDPAKIPKIENFSIQDGYADKFALTWDYNSSCQYKIEWQSYNADGSVLGEDSYTLTDADTASFTNGSSATYNLAATSGDRRKFTLIADSGLKATETKNDIYETLGTVVPVISDYDYSTITVSWDKVQKADSTYQVSAHYPADSGYTDELLVTSGADQNTEITEADGKYTCKITKPYGYDKANLSGLPVTLVITATNAATGSSTEAKPSVYTVGPASEKAEFVTEDTNPEVKQDREINIQWNKVTGAESYVIQRVIYADGTANSSNLYKADKYFFNAKTEEISVSTGEIGSNRVSIKTTEAGKYLLTDTYQEPSSSDGYQNNQARINWGLPFGYIILPVKEGGTADDFIFSDPDLLKLDDSSASGINYSKKEDSENPGSYIYENLNAAIGATYGYGLSVTASKAENSATITVSWNRPMANDKTAPIVYRKSSADSKWTALSSLGKDIVSYNDTLAGLSDDAKTKAYYYAVQYSKASDSDLNYTSSYSDHLKTADIRYNDGITSEALNKGYLFYIGFSAGYNGTTDEDGKISKTDGYYYSEKVSHKQWDFDERARGPASFSVYAKNLNTTYDYIKLADVAIKSSVENPSLKEETFTLNSTEGVLQGDGNDTHIEQNSSDLILYPIGITKGSATETDGIMKILRSSKTYYKLTSSRSFEVSGNSKTVSYEPEVYAYRQITDTELAKSIGLIIADALYKCGIPSADGMVMSAEETERSCTGGNGTLTIKHTAWQKRIQWYFTNLYRHSFVNGCSSVWSSTYSSDFAFTSDTSENAVGGDANTLYYLAPLNLTIQHDSGLETYNCVINFTAGTAGSSTLNIGSTKLAWNLTVLKTQNSSSSTIASVSGNQTSFLTYFPYDIGSKHENGDSTVNTSLQTYQGSWWN